MSLTKEQKEIQRICAKLSGALVCATDGTNAEWLLGIALDRMKKAESEVGILRATVKALEADLEHAQFALDDWCEDGFYP